MLAQEIRPLFPSGSPLSISLFRCARQMPHYHPDTIELILCLQGSLTVYNMHEKHILTAGDLLQTDMYDIHTIGADRKGKDENHSLAASFHIDLNHPGFSDQGYDLLYYICSSDEISPSQREPLQRILLLLLAALSAWLSGEAPVRTESLAKAALRIVRNHFQYFDHINTSDEFSSGEMRERFERIMSYLLKNYKGKTDMKRICESENISYTYLSKFFKASSLKTFRNFLHEIRVYHSEHLLLCYPELSIPDIAYRVGFSDPKYYYREFKKKHGHTPHQHRIWYRKYNEDVQPDLVLDPREHLEEIDGCIRRLLSEAIYLAECEPGLPFSNPSEISREHPASPGEDGSPFP